MVPIGEIMETKYKRLSAVVRELLVVQEKLDACLLEETFAEIEFTPAVVERVNDEIELLRQKAIKALEGLLKSSVKPIDKSRGI